MKKEQIIPIGSDHAGFELKEKVIAMLEKDGYTIKDFGPFNDDRVDYPDFGHPVADYVSDNKCIGIVICGSGNGINMTVNKHKFVRSALCWNTEIAELARLHNDANIIALPARFVSTNEALEMVKIFISTEFEGGRHQNRVAKIACS